MPSKTPPTTPPKTPPARGERRSTEVERETIPLVEERVHVDKRVVEGRTVTVHSRPVSETVTVSEPVRRETIEIERRPVNKVVETAPEVQESDDVTIIPVVEERVRVVTDLVLVEEIHLRRRSETVEETIEVEKRRTEIDIED